MHNSVPTRLMAWLIAASLLLCGCSRAPQYAALPAGSVVLAMGDSVTFGTGAAAGEDYPSQLAAITQWTIHNHGIPGDTSSGVLARTAAALDETQPALVILEIGGNDFLRRRPEAEVKNNVRDILRQVRKLNIPVVLVATPKFSPLGAVVGMLPDSPIYAELAEEEKTPLVPAVFARVLSEPELKADPIHPNAAGYRKLAEGIASELMKTGFLQKR